MECSYLLYVEVKNIIYVFEEIIFLVPNVHWGHVFSSALSITGASPYTPIMPCTQHCLVYGISKEPRVLEITRITSSTMLSMLANDQQERLQRAVRLPIRTAYSSLRRCLFIFLGEHVTR